MSIRGRGRSMTCGNVTYGQHARIETTISRVGGRRPNWAKREFKSREAMPYRSSLAVKGMPACHVMSRVH